ncbi:MAG: hypothetical protein F6J96_02130 [Symploca sp. SIO1C2]|nr:hypothetical protein [Symploca sp. SIO1C2]
MLYLSYTRDTKTQEAGFWFGARLPLLCRERSHYPNIIDFKRPVGRVYHRDGTITENVTRINIKRKLDGTLRYAYPVTDTYTLKREGEKYE